MYGSDHTYWSRQLRCGCASAALPPPSESGEISAGSRGGRRTARGDEDGVVTPDALLRGDEAMAGAVWPARAMDAGGAGGGRRGWGATAAGAIAGAGGGRCFRCAAGLGSIAEDESESGGEVPHPL